MLKIENITKSYFNEEGNISRLILDGLHLEVSAGESIAVTGPSGSGKTTLLNLIGLLDNPDSGRIIFEGADLAGLSEREQAIFRNTRIGFVFQFHHLFPQLTLLENIMLPALASPKRHNKEILLRAGQLADRLGLTPVRHQKPSALSGGECQRAAVARALINRPSLILADEPTGALDHHTARSLADLLAEMNRLEGTTILMVTHSAEVAGSMAKRYTLEEGKLTNI